MTKFEESWVKVNCFSESQSNWYTYEFYDGGDYVKKNTTILSMLVWFDNY